MKEKISILLIGFMLMFSGCGKQDVQVYYWDNEGNDVLTSKMKTDRQSENGFVRNFLETYNADMETKEELLDIDRKSTRLNSSHKHRSRMPSSA